MRLKTLRAHFGMDGNVQAVGSEYEAPDPLARMLIAAGKAVAIPAPAARAKAPAKAEPQKAATPQKSDFTKPMTTASAPALVAGTPERTEPCSPAPLPKP